LAAIALFALTTANDEIVRSWSYVVIIAQYGLMLTKPCWLPMTSSGRFKKALVKSRAVFSRLLSKPRF
jgi:hypothetical protein